MLDKIKSIPYSYSAMATLAVILGFVTGGFPYNSEVTLVALLVVMSLSTRDVRFRELRSLRGHLKDFLIVFLLNYVLLTVSMAGLAYLLFSDIKLIQGMVVFALMPSAIAVIPFTKMVDGDMELSLISTSLLYLSSLVMVPVFLFLLFGNEVGLIPILKNLFIMLVLPIFISRILLKVGYEERKHDKAIVNTSFLIIIMGAIGTNRHLFFDRTEILLPIFFIGLVRSIGLTSITAFIGKKLGSPHKKLRSYILFSGYKNGGLSIILAVLLFGAEASFPIVVGFPFDLILIIYIMNILIDKLELTAN
ncbi:MAG: hypothetical protein ACQESD_00055 [Thermoplasmatota archaeon]